MKKLAAAKKKQMEKLLFENIITKEKCYSKEQSDTWIGK